MLSLSCIIRYASNLRKSVEIFENLTLLLEKKTRWFIIRIKRAAVQYLHIGKSGYLIFALDVKKPYGAPRWLPVQKIQRKGRHFEDRF